MKSRSVLLCLLALVLAWTPTDARNPRGGATGAIAGGSALVITAPATLPAAQSGFQYSLALQTVLGVTPYTWTLVSQTGGNGFALSSTGLLTGAPTSSGTSTITVAATDSTGGTPLSTGNVTLTLPVTAVNNSPTITSSATLPNATNNGAYFYKIGTSGGTPPFKFVVGTVTGTNTWQTNVTYDSGYLSGAPTTSETDSIPVTVTDANGNTTSKTFSITVDSHLAIQGTSQDSSADQPLPAAMNGNKYSHTFYAAGGTGSGYTWSLQSGSLPTGITLSGATISGTPTVTGLVSSIVMKVTDGGSNTATQSFSLNVAPSLNVSRPSWNSTTANGFFVKSGQLYDPNGAPFRIRGLNQDHYDQGSATTWLRTQSAAVRFGLYNGASDATQAAAMNTQHVANNQFTIVTRFGNITTPPAAQGNSSGSSAQALLGAMTVDWINGFSSWSPYMAKIGINVANEWGPSNSTNWRDAYLGVSGAISAASGTTITINTVSGTNPFAGGPVGLTYAYIKGATGLSDKVVAISAVGGSSGAWTITTSTSLAGWTSGGTLYGGAVAMLRAVGYTCPIFIDSGGSGQDMNDPQNYAAAILASDPLQNIVFTMHMYGNFTPNAMPITAVSSGNSVTYSNFSLPWGPTSTNPFRGTYANSGSNNNFITNVEVHGVGGMTGVNGSHTIAPALGTGTSFSVTISGSNTGTYTSGTGWIYDQAYYRFAISQLAAQASNGICYAVMEFGPPDPPLNQAPNSTNINPYQVIVTAEQNGLGWMPWAFDDNVGSNTFGMQLVLSTYAKPSDLSPWGIDAILNPLYGVSTQSSPASSLLP